MNDQSRARKILNEVGAFKPDSFDLAANEVIQYLWDVEVGSQDLVNRMLTVLDRKLDYLTTLGTPAQKKFVLQLIKHVNDAEVGSQDEVMKLIDDVAGALDKTNRRHYGA